MVLWTLSTRNLNLIERAEAWIVGDDLHTKRQKTHQETAGFATSLAQDLMHGCQMQKKIILNE
jgi:hypothetical protein